MSSVSWGAPLPWNTERPGVKGVEMFLSHPGRVSSVTSVSTESGRPPGPWSYESRVRPSTSGPPTPYTQWWIDGTEPHVSTPFPIPDLWVR